MVCLSALGWTCLLSASLHWFGLRPLTVSSTSSTCLPPFLPSFAALFDSLEKETGDVLGRRLLAAYNLVARDSAGGLRELLQHGLGEQVERLGAVGPDVAGAVAELKRMAA